MAFPTGWGRKCAVVIDHLQVAGSGSHTDFPVLVTEAMLPAEMFDIVGSFPALNGGGDIRFSSDAAGTVQLALEVVSFVTDPNPANGSAELWVKVPGVSATVDTVIYVWYGKAGEVQPAVTDTYGRNAVWADYAAVYHMDTAGVQSDSTGGLNLSGAGNPTSVNGTIGNALSLDGAGDYYLRADSPRVDESFTESVWFSSVSTAAVTWISDDGDGTSGGFQTLINQPAGTVRTRIDDSGSNGGVFDTTSVVDDGVSRLLHTVVDKLAIASHYLNGVADGGTLDISGYGDISPSWPLTLGASDDAIGYLFGTLDEYRIRKSVLSTAWMLTEHANQSSPATFATAGTPESASAGTTPVTVDLSLQWNLLQQLTTDNDTRWNILNAVETDLQLAWQLLNQVTRDEFTSWDILQQLSRDVNLSWDVIAALFHITGDMNLRWSIINAVQKDQQTAWDLLNSVNRSTAMSWNLLNAMTRDMQTDWHILETVERDVDLQWDVNSSLISVTTDLDLTWNLLQSIVSSYDTQWDLLEAVTGDQNIRWDIANAVVAELGATWNIVNGVVADLPLRWNSLEAAQNSLTLLWSVDGLAISPITYITVRPEIREFPVSPEIRLIPAPLENRIIPVRRI